MVIDDGGAVEVGVAVGGEGVGLLVWVWVGCHGCGFVFMVSVFFFFLGVYGRLWVASGGGVRCVKCSGVGHVVTKVSVNLWLLLNRKNERERINNVLHCK